MLQCWHLTLSAPLHTRIVKAQLLQAGRIRMVVAHHWSTSPQRFLLRQAHCHPCDPPSQLEKAEFVAWVGVPGHSGRLQVLRSTVELGNDHCLLASILRRLQELSCLGEKVIMCREAIDSPVFESRRSLL